MLLPVSEGHITTSMKRMVAIDAKLDPLSTGRSSCTKIVSITHGTLRFAQPDAYMRYASMQTP